MQAHSPISLDSTTSVTFKSMTFENAIAVARLPQKHHEHKISVFLQAILANNTLPFLLPAQQRHFLMMKYLQAEKESFDFNIDFEKYEKQAMEPKEQVEIGGYVFRHLNGYECEALELYATSYLDWILGALSLQVSGNGIAELPQSTNTQFTQNILANRVPEITRKTLGESEKLINYFFEANDRLNHLVDLSFDDDGIVCLSQGGTEDAPRRFCPLSAIPTGIKALLRGISK